MASTLTLDVFKGVMDIADQLDGIHPNEWSNFIFQRMPLGKKSVGMMTMHTQSLGSDSVQSQVYNYWEKPFNQRSGAVLDIYDGPGLTNASSGSAAAGAIRTIAMTKKNAQLWNIHDGIMLTDTTSWARITGRIVDISIVDDTTSYVTAYFPKADSSSIFASSTVRFDPSAAAFPNKTELPQGRAYKPTKYTAVMSNRLAAWSLTIHEMIEKSRIAKSVAQTAIEDATQDLLIANELGNLFSQMDDSDPRQYMSQGLYDAVSTRTTGGSNIINFKTDTNYLGSATGSFVLLGYQLLRNIGEYVSRDVGGGVWKCYCGGLALEAIDAMLADRVGVRVSDTTQIDDFGFRFKTLHTLNGDFEFYQHPLMSKSPSFQNSIIGVRNELIKVKTFIPLQYIDPAEFAKIAEAQKGGPKLDGTNWSTEQKGGWFECKGQEIYNADAHFFLDGVGLDTAFDR